VINFTTNWSDGKALCALIDAVILPEKVNLFANISQDFVGNCRLAIDFATSRMDIPPLLDPEDIVNSGDEQTNLTYITYFREFENKKGKLKPLTIVTHQEDMHEQERLKQIAELEEEERQIDELEEQERQNAEKESLRIQMEHKPEEDVEVEYLDNYIKEREDDKLLQRKRCVHIPNCRANGPGLESPGMEGIKATFTVEARNIDNSLTEEGGHPFLVSITGVGVDNIPLIVLDKENGQYEVQYAPPLPGTYVIGVTLEGLSIEGSPYTVKVIKFKTAPLPHWFYQEGKLWVPYENSVSIEMENIYQDLLLFANGVGSTCVTHKGINYNIDFGKMKERGKKNETYFERHMVLQR